MLFILQLFINMFIVFYNYIFSSYILYIICLFKPIATFEC